tara:strand:- start:1058 stop:1480 length:423 start_codon:yes stop_codon:yes gene_type:complete
MNLEDINLLTTSRTTRLNGLAFPVIEGAGGFFTMTDGAETVMAGLKQLLLTNRGERVMRPDFGTSLRKSVFEPYTASLKIQLREEIKATIRKYEPRVDIIDLSLSWESRPQSAGLHHIFISLKFKLKGEITEPQILDIIV